MRGRGAGLRRGPDVLGLAWTVVAAVVVMVPVLRPGVQLGPFDLLSRVGLTRHPGTGVHSQFPADQVLYFLPLTNLAWHQVHQGHLPLWNPDNVLGVPLAFTWQSGVFSVPVLLSYLFPVHAAYTVIVLAKLVLAGTGAYVLCRVLGTGALAAAFGGTVFELSGPMLHYSGWAMTGVTCWAGWIFAAAVLVVRGGRRLRHVVLLALAVAAAVYGGHPESLVVLGVSLAVFLAVVLGVRAGRDGGALRRPVLDLVTGGACGLGLGAPLLLPGLQVVQVSGRAGAAGGAAYAPAHLSDLLTGLQGVDFRVPSPYVGVVAAVLAVTALVLRRRRVEVLGLGAVALAGILLTFRTPLTSVLADAPGLGQITWNRDVMLLALALAVLGALGLDALVRGDVGVSWRRLALWCSAGAAVVVAGVCLAVGLGAQLTSGGGERARLAWAGAEVLAVAAVALTAATGGDGPGASRRRRWSAAALAALQGAVLVVLGVSFWSISSTGFSPTPAVRALQRAVGPSLVGFDAPPQPGGGDCRPKPFTAPYSNEVGVRPNVNAVYGVHEFAVYEPALDGAYFSSWTEASGGKRVGPGLRRVGLFCPQLTSVAQARLYGVRYLLVAAGARAPAGTHRVATVGGEELVAVPGAARATLSVPPPAGATLGAGAPGTPVAATQPDPASWRVVTDAPGPRVLRLRVTAEPGWSATVDGRPLRLERWSAGAMLEATVPAGRHVVELRYSPALFGDGVVLGAVVALGLLGAGVVARRRRLTSRSAR